MNRFFQWPETMEFHAELLSLSSAELERLFKEQHTRENPYVFLMPNGIHKFAVYPEETLGKYDLEFTAQEFMTFVAINGKLKLKLIVLGMANGIA